MTDTPDIPAPVKTGAMVAAIMSLLRSAGVVATAMIAIAGFVSRHDLRGLIAFAQGDAMIPVVAASVALGTAGYGAWKRWQDHQVKAAAKS